MIDMWNLNIEPNKNYHVFQSTVIRSHRQTFVFPFIYFSKNIAKRRNSANVIPFAPDGKWLGARPQSPGLLSNSIKDGKTAPSKRKTHTETGKSMDFVSFLDRSNHLFSL